MRKPTTMDYMYIDFDGFFASVEEQRNPALHGRPVGVIPFAHTHATILIAANAKAKAQGVKTGTPVMDARRLCPDITCVPQSPELYVRIHRAFLDEIETVIPVDRVCSIDEVGCKLSPLDLRAPEGLVQTLKTKLRRRLGPYITCSIGMAPNLLLAKIAGDMNKPDGFTMLRPEDLPGPLLDLDIEDLPGIGKRMGKRLRQAGVWSVEELWNTAPKQLRALWNNVNGERFWYALHGYDVKPIETKPCMFGHGRVLPPEHRRLDEAYGYARTLTVKAARRMRREDYVARQFGLWTRMGDDRWGGELHLCETNDDHSSLIALKTLWNRMCSEVPRSARIKHLHIAHFNVVPEAHKQMDFLAPRNAHREKWQRISNAVDDLNTRFRATLVSEGPWTPPPGGYAGAKIAFTHVPETEDFC